MKQLFNIGKPIYKWCLFLFTGTLLSINSYAQEANAHATLDSTNIFIGGQIDLKIELSQSAGQKIVFPTLNDTITKNVEIVEKGQVDTMRMENNRILLTQILRITSFDSGLHYIPPFVFELAEETAQKLIKTEPLALNVFNPFRDVDPQKGITDIKAPLDTPFILSEILTKELIGGLIAALLLIGLIIYLVYRHQQKKKLEGGFIPKKPLEPAHVIALRELDRIKSEKLWQRDLEKRYYTDLSQTLRQYIEFRFNVPALEQTTEEIMQSIKYMDLGGKESLENLKQVLQLADLVKFAKFKPLPDENDLSMIHSYFFVNQSKLEIMKSLEEQKLEIETEQSTRDTDHSTSK